ncbi:MAG: PAS domain S-box protein, partial [Chloroflexota bacterium]
MIQQGVMVGQGNHNSRQKTAQQGEIQRMKLIEAVFRSSLQPSSRSERLDFFKTLCRQLGESLAVSEVWIAEVQPTHSARMLAYWRAGSIVEPETYDLTGTPCALVTRGETYYQPRGVRKAFPGYRADGYLGLPLYDATEKVAGHLVLLHADGLTLIDAVREALALIADWAADELVRRRKVDNLEASERRFRLLFEQSPVAQVINDDTGRIIQANAAAIDLFGYSRSELTTYTLMDVTHPESVETTRVIHAELVAGDRPFVQIEKRYQRKDDTFLDCRTTVFTIRDEAGRFLHTIAFIEDISERKRRDELVQTLAHDLKNPLTNISAASAMLRELIAEPNEDTTQIIGLMQQSATRMFDLINRLLDLSRIEMGVRLERESVLLNTYLPGLLADFAIVAAEKALDLVFTPLNQDVAVDIDPALMQ